MSYVAVESVVRLPNITVMGRHLFVSRSDQPLALDRLGAAERARYDAIYPEERAIEWLTGRAAVHAAAAASVIDDQLLVSPPHACLSLSHSRGMSIAVSVAAAVGQPDHGLGVDYERDGPMSRDAVQLFSAMKRLKC